ncbi:MAG: hypothetical protein ACHQ2Y_00150 [Candidatus Lutacidiplasmatales archaeon]
MAGQGLSAGAGGSTAPHFLSSASAEPSIIVRGSAHPGAISCSGSGLCPSQLRQAYNFTGLVNNASTNGTGQSIVIVDACGDSKIASDLTTFDKAFHLPAATLTVYHPQGTPCAQTSWAIETALDVEWSHAMAPGAAINLVIASKSTDASLYAAWNYSLLNKLGLQISNSWGGNGGCSSVPKTIIATAAAAGVTVLASAGDSGAWGSGTRAKVQLPADCNQTIAVGGTTLSMSKGGGYGSESAWGGSGGGYVTGTVEPLDQKAAKIPDSYKQVAKPDVSAVADPLTGVWVYEQRLGGWTVVGGTSVSCPLWAGFVADANSWRAANSFGSLGAFGAYLYLHVYGAGGLSANYSATIHDVTTGSNGWSAGTGWDAATGIGSFNAYPLAQQLGNDPAA